MLNCSRPDRPALLQALSPVFDLRSIRPVMNLSVTTNITIDFTLVGILAVVRDAVFVSADNAWEARRVRRNTPLTLTPTILLSLVVVVCVFIPG